MSRSLALLFLLLFAPGAAGADVIRPMVGELKLHVVKEGEDLFEIAQSYSLAVDHLAFANGFPITSLDVAPGTKLVIPTWRILPDNPPHNGLVLNLAERGFYYFRNGKFEKFYPCSIGDERDFLTGTGQFHIIEKIKHPTWYPPAWAEEKGPVGPGPDNPLGTRWIGLSLPRTGIHGTNQPLNIGNSVTHGCIRTYPSQVEEIYDRVQVGWPVRIEYETVKLGRGADGQIYVATFPDVYSKLPVVDAARRLMGKAGLEARLGRSNLMDVVKLTMGIPVNTRRDVTVYEEIHSRFTVAEDQAEVSRVDKEEE